MNPEVESKEAGTRKAPMTELQFNDLMRYLLSIERAE
jgi:hypothetical protein